MTKNNEQIIDNLGSEKCVHRAHLGYKDAPYFKKCYSCRLQNHQLEAVQGNNTTEYWYKCNTENCLFKKLEDKEQECVRWEEINKYSQDKLLEQVKVVCKLKQTLAEIRNVLDTYFDDDWKATREIEKILKGKDNG